MIIQKHIKATLIAFALIFTCSEGIKAQNVGVSFSFFFPKNGSFSVPISPFSLRGVGFDINRYIAIESGFSLYRMSGMNVTDVPFESEDPIIGPATMLLVPAELVFQIGNSTQQFRIKGGGFAFYNFSNNVMTGNLDKALRESEGWDVLNSEFSFDNKIGFGWQAGVEYILYVTREFGITLGASYFAGGADLNLGGSYVAGNDGSGLVRIIETFPDSRLDFTGWEITIGALFGG